MSEHYKHLDHFMNSCDADLDEVVEVCNAFQMFLNSPGMADKRPEIILAGIKVIGRSISDALPQSRVIANLYAELVSTQTEIQDKPLNEEKEGSNV